MPRDHILGPDLVRCAQRYVAHDVAKPRPTVGHEVSTPGRVDEVVNDNVAERFPRVRAVRGAPIRRLRAAGKHARRRLPLLQRQLYRWAALRPAAPAMRSKLVETSQGVRGMSQRNSTTQRLVFAAQHARELAG